MSADVRIKYGVSGSQRGLSKVEYFVLLSCIAMVIIVSVPKIGQKAGDVFNTAATSGFAAVNSGNSANSKNNVDSTSTSTDDQNSAEGKSGGNSRSSTGNKDSDDSKGKENSKNDRRH